MKRYRGRFIGVGIVIFFMTVWDFIFYYVLNNPINWTADMIYSILILLVGAWVGGFYDQNLINLANLKKSEERYKKLSDEMRIVLENIGDVVFHSDSEGYFQYLNPAWEKFTGYTLKESLYMNALHFLPLEDRHDIVKMVRKALSDKAEHARFEFAYRKKEGGRFWGEVQMKFYYDQYGELEGTIGTISDITESIYAKEELIEMNENLAVQSQKLSIAGQLAAGIAHEVRNPLTAINGFLQLIKGDQKENHQYLDIIFSEIKRIELVLSELLILAKPQAITFKEKNVIEILHQVVTLLETNAILYNVAIHKQFQDEHIHIRCDENQLKQVFINLIKNAIEAMPHGGNIYITAKNKNGCAELSFRDEGVGMNKKTLKKLGEPFYTTKDKGTGLGLTVCLRILKDHHGSINVESDEGIGTDFQIAIPLAVSRKVQTRRLSVVSKG
ncbi:ATP-binding protein [Rossellomorea sp. BNER]|uniref:ATP-binding protein n=1 Tax=Rossellomorea sp. BNER TaxID=2962031 RepID=UPI003AF259AE|nr:ATP-binding protein [Rossellomorea sp. BNER]